MKRHAGLEPLSHDHQQGLVHALRLNKAAAGKIPVEPALDDFLAFYPTELSRHFREEEEVLGPILAEKAGEDDPQRARLFREHAALHVLADEARAARASGLSGEALVPIAGAIGQLLEPHIRFEERELFPRLEALLTEEELLALPPHFTGGTRYRPR